MFTGLVEDTGQVASVRSSAGGRVVTIACGLELEESGIGDSVAVDGVCLTAETLDPAAGRFTVTAGPETLSLTTLDELRPGRRVHLERALRAGDRLGGHLVQGHVDTVGRVVEASTREGARRYWIDVGPAWARYVVAKGSICLDGVSLTVNEVRGSRVRVDIIPHTIEVTRFGALTVGARVNVEVDVLAKYVERLLGLDGDRESSLVRALQDRGPR